jgi:uncharacterized metal-binding protein
MKRDMELIRELLFKLEAYEGSPLDPLPDLDIADDQIERWGYQIWLARDAGLLPPR